MTHKDTDFALQGEMREGVEQINPSEPQPGTEAWRKKQLEAAQKRLAEEDAREDLRGTTSEDVDNLVSGIDKLHN